MTDGYWYHGNGKIGEEFHPTKPNDEERYGEYVKVKHGHWVYKGNTGWHCSECDAQAPFWCFATTQNLSAYCPNCGAKMSADWEDDEENVSKVELDYSQICWASAKCKYKTKDGNCKLNHCVR